MWKELAFSDMRRFLAPIILCGAGFARASSGDSFSFNSGGLSYEAVLPADVNGDGRVDIVRRTGAQEVVWFENIGGGQGDSPQFANTSRAIVTDETFTMIVAADLDADGDVDLVGAANNARQLVWYENVGAVPEETGTDTDTEIEVGAETGTSAWSWSRHLIHDGITSGDIQFLAGGEISVADFDGDGAVDVLVASPNQHRIVWFSNTGSAGSQFGTRQEITNVSSTDGRPSNVNRPSSVVAVDIDSDGLMDLVAADTYESEGRIVWMRNTGDGNGGFEMNIIERLGDAGAFSRVRVLAADLDNDGDAEVLVYSPDNTQFLRWYENTDLDRRFDLAKVFPVGAVRSVALADYDRDGRIDIAAHDGRTVTLFANTYGAETTDPQGHFSRGTVVAVGTTHSVFFADLNGDGADELAVFGDLDGDMSAKLVAFENGAWTVPVTAPANDEPLQYVANGWYGIPGANTIEKELPGATNWEFCQKECLARPQCNVWTWRVREQNCHLGTAETQGEFNNEPDHYSCRTRECQRYNGCVNGVGYFQSQTVNGVSGRIRDPFVVNDWEACQAECLANDACVSWTYRTAEYPPVSNAGPNECIILHRITGTFIEEAGHITCQGPKCDAYCEPELTSFIDQGWYMIPQADTIVHTLDGPSIAPNTPDTPVQARLEAMDETLAMLDVKLETLLKAIHWAI